MKQKYQEVNDDISQNKYDSALKKLNLILNNNNFDIFALIKKGNILLQQNDYYGALNCFNNILVLFQDNLDALVGKSKALFGLKQYKDAFNIYNKSIELKENSVDVNFYNELFELSQKGNLPLPVNTYLEDKELIKTDNISEKYIIFTNNYYRVRKILNGKHKNFGSFKDIEKACNLRDLLIDNDWDESKIPKQYFSDHSNSEGKYGKYITFKNNYYRISKTINGKQKFFGSFKDINNAIVLRDLLIENGWVESGIPKKFFSDHSSSNKSKYGKNIIFVNDYFKVNKQINGKRKMFGSFENVENALRLRDLLIDSNWDESKIPKQYFSDHSNSEGKYGKYITFKNNYYRISKTINGKQKFFGSFKDINNAIVLRDLLIENGWVESGIPKKFFSDHSSSNKSKYGKNIIFVNDYFKVNKQINGKRKMFGSFENVENALRLRDLLNKNDWDKTNIPREFLNDHTNSKKELKFGKYIKFNYNFFRVQNTVNGEERNFGSFKEGENAAFLRDLLIKNNWNETEIDKKFFSDYENVDRNKYAKNISRINDKFKVNKTINGKLKFFGSFKHLGNAVRLRDLLIESNWTESTIPEEFFRDYSSSNRGSEYIVCINNLYKVNKIIDGKQKYFGSFKEKSNAIQLRDLLIENEWDDSNIPEKFFSDYEGYKKRNRYGKNIALVNKYFRVYKLDEGKRKYMGSFVNVENARRLRDLLIENEWDETNISNQFFTDHDNARIKR